MMRSALRIMVMPRMPGGWWRGPALGTWTDRMAAVTGIFAPTLTPASIAAPLTSVSSATLPVPVSLAAPLSPRLPMLH